MYEYLVTQIDGNVTPPTIAAAPNTLTATADADSIELEWVNGDTYSATVIMRKSDGGFEALDTAAGAATTYDDETAVPGTEYTYIVRGVKDGYPTQYSNEDSDTVPLAGAASASFAGTTEPTASLLSASGASLNKTNTDSIIVGAWVKYTVGGQISGTSIIGKFRSDDTVDYYLDVDSNSKFRFNCKLPAGEAQVISAAAAVEDTKYFVLGYVNPSTKNIYLSVNGGADVAYDYTVDDGVVAADNGVVEIGGGFVSGSPADVLIDEVFICKNPADLSAAITLIKASIYNSGTGVRYSGVSAGDRTTIGLVSWWGLDEAASTREDLHGTVDLTPTEVTQGTALVA